LSKSKEYALDEEEDNLDLDNIINPLSNKKTFTNEENRIKESINEEIMNESKKTSKRKNKNNIENEKNFKKKKNKK
jgi:hypothetical protein